MASSRQLNELSVRKQLLIAQADMQRQLLTLECTRLGNPGAVANELIQRHRWWLLAGSAVVGIVLARRWRGFAGWLPPILATARAFLR